MDTKSQSAGNLVYEDFEPDFQWLRDETSATLTVLLPGFRRDHLKVQVNSTPTVKIIGERQISDNKWRRFTKELSIPSECDTNDITAKFERGRLNIKFSIKTSKPQQEEAKPSSEVSEQKKTVPEEQKKEEKEADQGEEKRRKKKVTTSGVVENIPSETIGRKNGESFRATEGPIQRTKTRVLDYTISLKPSLESEDLKKPKNWVNMILLFLFAVVLVIYVKQAFKSFLEAK